MSRNWNVSEMSPRLAVRLRNDLLSLAQSKSLMLQQSQWEYHDDESLRWMAEQFKDVVKNARIVLWDDIGVLQAALDLGSSGLLHGSLTSSHVPPDILMYAVKGETMCGAQNVFGLADGYQCCIVFLVPAMGYNKETHSLTRLGLKLVFVWAPDTHQGVSLPQFRFFPTVFEGDPIPHYYDQFISSYQFLNSEYIRQRRLDDAEYLDLSSRKNRRLHRRGKIENADIRVVVLRKCLPSQAVTGEKTINWNCQWLVKGHWRKKRDGSRVFIKPYVKGPEGKPLKPPTETVYRVRQ